MNTILIAILFVIPGLLVRNIEKRLFTRTKENDSDYIKQYNFFIDSVFIYITGVIFINLLALTPIYDYMNKINLNGILLKENTLKMFVGYFIWALIICYPYTKSKRYVTQKMFLDISNTFRNKKKMPVETKFSSVWDEIFENEENPITQDEIVLIEKDGALITQGYLESYSPPHLSKREFKLVETSQVKRFLESDKNAENEAEKLLNVVKFEYYDTQSGIVIKFIDTQKLITYLNNLN